MQRIGPRAFIACQLLAGTSGLASSSCGGELRRKDDAPPSATCEWTSRAPVLDASTDGRIAIDGMDSNVSVVDVDAHGSGTDFVGSLRLSHGAGTLELGCEGLPVAVYESYEASGTLRFQAIAVKTDRLFTVAFECEQERLRFISLDSTDGAQHAPEVLEGSCRKGTFRAASEVVFPALDMPFPSTLHGYTIDGPYISLASDGRGRIVYNLGAFALGSVSELSASAEASLYGLAPGARRKPPTKRTSREEASRHAGAIPRARSAAAKRRSGSPCAASRPVTIRKKRRKQRPIRPRR